MQEILFRGKRKDFDNEWIYGFYTLYNDNRGMKPAIITGTEKHCFIPLEVIHETVEQYTGLTDKNGTKIFEGDIVAGALRWLEKAKNGIVAFKDGSFGLVWHRGSVEQFNPFTSMCNIEYEVIGNVHDNPELLKEVEE